MKKEKIWEVVFYQKENGNIPVLELLESLSLKMRAKALNEIELLQEHGIFLREPYVKAIKGKKYRGLYELRVKLGNDAARIFYFSFRGNIFVLLNGYLKKTNKTPSREIERALNYKCDYEKRYKNE